MWSIETAYFVLGLIVGLLIASIFWVVLILLDQKEEEDIQNDNKVTLKEAAVMNCYLCSGLHSKFHPKPYHQRGHGGYIHNGETASSDSIPCQSSQLWEHIDALSKET